MTGEELRNVVLKRHDILTAISEQPRGKPKLVDAVGTSRSTIDRGVSDLEEVGCIKRDGNKYILTTKGKLALREANEFSKVTGSLSEGTDTINQLSVDAEVGREFLKGLSVTAADTHVPDATLSMTNDIVRSSSKLVGLAPVALASYPKVLGDAVEDRGLQAELVVERDVLASLYQVCRSEVSRLFSHENVTIWVSDDPLPYPLWIAEGDGEDTAGITVLQGGLKGILLNRTEAGVDWARKTFTDYRQGTEKFAEEMVEPMEN